MKSLLAVIVGCSREARARVAKMLAPYGFDCIAVRDKDAALEVASGGAVDLFVIDIDKPEAGGVELDALIRDGELGAERPQAILYSSHQSRSLASGAAAPTRKDFVRRTRRAASGRGGGGC